MAGQGKARGAVLWLHGHLFLGMELLADAENRQHRAPWKKSLILGHHSVPHSVSGRKHGLVSGLVSTRKGNGKCFLLPGWKLLQSHVPGCPEFALCHWAGTVPLLCHPQTCSCSVLPAFPQPAELVGGDGNKTSSGWQDTVPFCRDAAAVWRGSGKITVFLLQAVPGQGPPLFRLSAWLRSH